LKRDDLYIVAVILYLVGVWLHFPYGGGHIYSDIPTVFWLRECSGSCLTIPYVNGFIEYPVIVSGFIYLMGVLSSYLPGNVVDNYYYLTVIILAIPTFLLISETLEIARIIGTNENRILWYVVATPSFLFILLLNWYVIGVYFTVFGIRKFMQGSFGASGILLALSAASNLVTAAPALGMMLAVKNRREAINFTIPAVACYLAINVPFVAVNPQLWLSFWQFHTNWYIEGSWMLAFLSSFSPLRHYIFPALFVLIYGTIVWMYRKSRNNGVLTLSWLSTFAFLFSTYVFTPQMQIMLLPFFALVPIVRRYWEFLAFDIINSLFIILAFSQILLPFGITYHFDVSVYAAPVRWLAIARSVWLGKMLIFDGLPSLRPDKIHTRLSSLRIFGDSKNLPTQTLHLSPTSTESHHKTGR
jgi:hypothetical protein